ncbi:MAG: sigma-70 family RNA polymerase sigma factor [Clostridia bacterium]|nr:sigma-70 family RNA polymerase sigma factor [Clostridia bacterium]
MKAPKNVIIGCCQPGRIFVCFREGRRSPINTAEARDPENHRDEQLEALVDRYQVSLLKVCFTFLRDKNLDKDAVQETFIKVYQHLDSFQKHSSEKTWIFRIVMNTCRDMLHSRWFRFVDRCVDLSHLPEQTMQTEEGDREIMESLMALPLRLREVILLCSFEGMTTYEAAASLGITQQAVSSR